MATKLVYKNVKDVSTILDPEDPLVIEAKKFIQGLPQNDHRILRFVTSAIHDLLQDRELRQNIRQKNHTAKIVTVFGTARSKPGDLSFDHLVRFSKAMNTKKNWFIQTGGGPGAMLAAVLGLDKAKRLGVGMEFPGEELPLTIFLKELYYRAATFLPRRRGLYKPSSAIVISFGGIGTVDEALQFFDIITRNPDKSVPIVLLVPDSEKEQKFSDVFMKLVARLDAQDATLKIGERILCTNDEQEAAEYIDQYGQPKPWLQFSDEEDLSSELGQAIPTPELEDVLFWEIARTLERHDNFKNNITKVLSEFARVPQPLDGPQAVYLGDMSKRPELTNKWDYLHFDLHIFGESESGISDFHELYPEFLIGYNTDAYIFSLDSLKELRFCSNILTSIQTGQMPLKPVVVIEPDLSEESLAASYKELLETLSECGTIDAEDLDLITFVQSPEEAGLFVDRFCGLFHSYKNVDQETTRIFFQPGVNISELDITGLPFDSYKLIEQGSLSGFELVVSQGKRAKAHHVRTIIDRVAEDNADFFKNLIFTPNCVTLQGTPDVVREEIKPRTPV